MLARAVIVMFCLMQEASGLLVQPRMQMQHAVRPAAMPARPVPLMQEATPPPEGEKAPETTPMAAPPTPPEPEGPAFDLANYSITISLAVVFILAKALAALGIIGDN